MSKLAFLSLHGCPVARLGEKDTGGMNVYILHVASELGRLGHQVDVFTRCHDCDESPVIELGTNARVVHVKAGPYDSTKESLFRYIPEYLGNLYRFQDTDGAAYDLVHSHYWLSGWAGMELSRKWGVPHVVTFHTLAKIKMRARPGEKETQLRIGTEGEVIRSADAIVVSTQQERDEIAELYEASASDTWVIPAGVDPDLFRPGDKAEAQRRLGLPDGKIILSVGRTEPLKGFDILINALALLDGHDDANLVIVGGNRGRDRELSRLRSLAASLGLRDRVTFTGAVDQSALPAFYNAADVFVLPSYYESFGLVALEAMACGTPVIASRVGGLKTFIESGKTGYLIPWQSAEPFARSLEVVLSSPQLRDALGSAARAQAETMDWSGPAGRLSSLYQSLQTASWEAAAGD